jgi:predicted TIM-barrel fold metal-dependent hydrolase
MLEGVGGIARWLSELPVDRILFGSHAPLFYFEAAFLKLKESALSPNDLQAIRYGNAARLATLH